LVSVLDHYIIEKSGKRSFRRRDAWETEKIKGGNKRKVSLFTTFNVINSSLDFLPKNYMQRIFEGTIFFSNDKIHPSCPQTSNNNLYLYNKWKKNFIFSRSLHQISFASQRRIHRFGAFIWEGWEICSEQMIRPCFSGSKRARFIRFFFNYSLADYLNFTSLFMQSDRVFVLESVSLEFPRLSRGSRFVPPYNGLPLQDYTRGIYTGWPRTFQLLTASLSFLSPRWKCCRAKWRALRWSKNSFHPAENASYTLVRQRTTGILVGLLVGRTR